MASTMSLATKTLLMKNMSRVVGSGQGSNQHGLNHEPRDGDTVHDEHAGKWLVASRAALDTSLTVSQRHCS